jgi:hypothetical protein
MMTSTRRMPHDVRLRSTPSQPILNVTGWADLWPVAPFGGWQMGRRPVALAVASVTAAVCLQASVSWPAAAQPDVPYCAPGQPAAFVFGIAALHDRLGDTMGAPLECEHLDSESGDTTQRTSTGLAYFRPSINTAIFTDGSTHWALVDGRVLRWAGTAVVPPLPTDAEAAYLRATTPLQARAAGLQRRLAATRQQVERGQLDSLDAATRRALTDDLRATSDAYAKVGGAGRFWQYHGMMVVSLNEGMGAAEMLTLARQVESPDVRARLLASASKHRQESERLQAAAQDAYGRALPIVVQ